MSNTLVAGTDRAERPRPGLITSTEYQIYVFAPTGSDAALTARFLSEGGHASRVFHSMSELCAEMARGCGAVVLAEETLGMGSVEALVGVLSHQPAWSDIPICIITSGGEVTQERLRRLAVFGPGGNVTLLERPFRPATLRSTVEVALRSRQRQYQVRDLVQKVRASEERLRRVFDQTPGGIAEMDLSGRFMLVNDRYCEIVGRTRDELMSLRMQDLTHVDDRGKTLAQFEALAGGKTSSLVTERRYVRPDGTPIWVQSHISTMHDTEGTLNGIAAVSADITDLKREQAVVSELSSKIEEQARLFDTTLSHISDLAYTFDLEGRFIYANKRLLDLLGLKMGEVIGKNCFDLHYPPDLAARLQGEIQNVIATTNAVSGGTYFADATGKEDYHEYIFTPVFDSAAQVVAVTGTSRLVTERKRAEAANEGQQRVLQLMAWDASLETVLEAIVKMVEATNFNKMYASILLVDESGKHLRTGAAPSLPAAYNQAIDGLEIGPNAGSCGTCAYIKRPVYVADISTDPLWPDFKDLAAKHGLRACWSTPIFSSQGGLLGTFAMYHPEPREPHEDDMKMVEFATRTAAVSIERKRSDAALRESEERFRTMADNIAQFAWITDAEGGVTWYNRRWYDYTGLSFEEGRGDGWTKVHHPDHVERVVKKITHGFKSGEVWEDTFPLRGRDGTYRWFLSSAVPVRNAQGKLLLWFGTNTDITERLEAQASLESVVKERTAELTETNIQLETLVYSIAHDLRAPLRSMQAFAQILLEDYAPNLDLTAKQYAQRIVRSAETMDALVLDLLDYGRIARADMALADVDVAEAWRCALSQFEEDILEKNAVVQTVGPLPHVRAHEATLSQVLANLLGNALKFSAPGLPPQVDFRAETTPDFVRLWVEDQGIGIAKEYHERIFRVFERLHSREYEGTGIGLSLVRKGVERMGGRVGLESDDGRPGCRFWIELPRTSA